MEYSFSEKKILLYPAGSVAGLIDDLLSQKDIQVVGFIDRRGDKIDEFRGKSVYTIKEAGSFFDTNEYCVVVCLRNVFEHSYIAQELIEAGFNNLLFKPLASLKGMGTDEDNRLRESHDMLLENKQLPEDSIPQVFNAIELEDGCLIEDGDDTVKAIIPCELLFTNILNSSSTIQWSQVNFLGEYVAVDLYESFGSNTDRLKENAEKYIEEFALPGATHAGVNTEGDWGALIIENRKAVYEEMVDLNVSNPYFFVENCPTVKRFDRGFYLVSSGKNRVSFQIARGNRLIPVEMDKEEYSRFINMDALKDTLALLRREGYPRFRTSIGHPYFVNYPVYTRSYSRLWLKQLGRILSNEVYSKNKRFVYTDINGWFLMDDQGVSERYLSSLGIRTYDASDKDALRESVDRLLCYICEDQKLESNYYFGVFDYEKYNSDKNKLFEFLRKTKRYIFAIYPCDPKIENRIFDDLWHWSFKKSAFLFNDVYGNMLVKGMAFEKEI